MFHTVCLFALMTLSAASAPDAVPVFSAGQPIWPQARETEKNLWVGFRAIVNKPAEAVTLRVTGSTIYRAYVNGQVCGYGPARGPQGYFRVDEWDISPLLVEGRNVVAIEVAGYNVNSYYVMDQPSFFQAEVTTEGKVLAATGSEPGFQGAILKERIQKVQRYSFQRPFVEAYRLDSDSDQWLKNPDAAFTVAACATVESKKILPRRVPYPVLNVRPALTLVSSGRALSGQPVEKPWRDRSLTDIGPKLGGYPESELECVTSLEMQGIKIAENTPVGAPMTPDKTLELAEGGFHIFDFGQNITGFPHLQVRCDQPVRLFVSFDETLTGTEVNWRRLGCVNVITYELQPGEYTLEAFEPYTMRYLQILAVKGACSVSQIGLRTYENPDTARAEFNAPDERLMRLFSAGKSTFAQNATDVFMDCPHRERAGWLCDSLFTSRSAFALSGDTRVEKNFFENFLLPDRFACLPEGMLPMCYPADHNDGVFIPNWALWFVIQLGEYMDRSGDRAMVDALKPRVMALLAYFQPFENDDGLLEKLKSWVFVEWSAANDFVQDVNYPSNMLYAGVLSTAARLYDMPDFEEKAQKIRETIRTQSYDGTFFVDNALRKGGSLKLTRNRSEVCQYFAFYFGVATPELYPELWAKLRDEFGPNRGKTKAYPEVHIANSFIGNMLRIELLSRAGLCQQLLDESIDYLDYMAVRTGTLWENTGDYASLNHGFASHIVVTLYRDALGLYRVDPVRKEIRLRFTPLTLSSCQGRIPIGADIIDLQWKRQDGKLTYRVVPPSGYTVVVENQSGGEIAEE